MIKPKMISQINKGSKGLNNTIKGLKLSLNN
jgi:hypothetical protein